MPANAAAVVRTAALPTVREGLARLVPLPVTIRLVGNPRQSLRAVSFVVLVLLPIAFVAAYFFAIAADQYVAEFRFTLSTVESPRLDPLSLLAGNASQSPAAIKSQILVQYIASRAMVDEVDAKLDLRRLFAPPAGRLVGPPAAAGDASKSWCITGRARSTRSTTRPTAPSRCGCGRLRRPTHCAWRKRSSPPASGWSTICRGERGAMRCIMPRPNWCKRKTGSNRCWARSAPSATGKG